MKTLALGLSPLKIEDVYGVAQKKLRVTLSKQARKKMELSRSYIEKAVSRGEVIYGVNTGFGALSNVHISEKNLETLQIRLLRSHATGVGDPLGPEPVRAMLLLRAANIAQGFSGVRPIVVDQLLRLLAADILPWIPCQGSVGASGDLAPLAHLALVLVGEGRAYFKGKLMPASSALKKAKIKPIQLSFKEGLALINGTQFMTALGCLALAQAEQLSDLADICAALSLEALRGSTAAYEKEIHEVRPHPGQIKVAERLRALLLPNNKFSEIARSHKDCGKVQDPYSLRCVPQVHGAVREGLRFTREILTTEINSVTDNPLIFPDSKKVLSGGNFHGQTVSMALDFLGIAVSELASISEQRIQKLINPVFSDLPAFLTEGNGLNSGFMIVQVAAAAIVSENKTLAHPASVDSIPTSTDKEDHVSMGAWASRKATQIVQNVNKVLTMELLVASTGIDFLRPLRTTPVLEKVLKKIRSVVPKVTQDRIFAYDLENISQITDQLTLE